MGLKFTNHFVASQVDTMSILSAIKNCASRIKTGQADPALQRWFADTSPAWKQTAQQRLEQLRKIINLQEISIGVSTLADRDTSENANALTGGATSIVPGTNTPDPLPLVQLNSAFLTLPRYLPRNGGAVDAGVYNPNLSNNQSKFESVIHELTHVILSTNDEQLTNGDEAYGTNRALTLATQKARRSRRPMRKTGAASSRSVWQVQWNLNRSSRRVTSTLRHGGSAVLASISSRLHARHSTAAVLIPLAMAFALITATSHLPNTAQAAEPDPVVEARIQAAIPEIETYIADGMKAFDVPGLAIGIVANDKLVYAKGFGVRSRPGGQSVDPHTVFQIGSTTKGFLATTIALMVDRGKLHWDDRAVDLYPGFQLRDPWVTREFRVYDLLAQRSGLPPYANDALGILGLEQGALIGSLRYVEPVSSFRSTFAYTNVTHTLAGSASSPRRRALGIGMRCCNGNCCSRWA